jgi:methylated-DNA-protein-cysteine methyltransferase-like protein
MSTFKDTIHKIIRQIPDGSVASYGQVASYAGIPRAARQVGWILSQSSPQDNLPWWRVINNAGRLSIKGSTYASPELQQDYLEKEGVEITGGFNVDIERYRWQPKAKILRQLGLDEDYLDELILKYSL